MKEKKDINVVISNILRCGVYISSALILIGIFLGLVKGVESSLTLERYSFNQMFNGLVEFDYYAYLMFGILYSGSSEIYVLFIFVYISFFITKALKIIIIIAKKYRETAINPEFCLKK